jgi:hypothetical protein
MTRDMRRLLKWPQRPRKWPLAARVLVGTLIVVIVVPVAWAVSIALHKAPNGPPADPWSATGTVFGGGAFVLAVLATIIATAAFVNSTERPELHLIAMYPGGTLIGPLTPAWTNGQPDESGQITSVAESSDWGLDLILYNAGPVAARFVALQVTFGDGARLDTKGSAGALAPWHRPTTVTDELRWEGGADAVVHPSWYYTVPQLGPTYLILEGPQSEASFQFEVEVVADDVAGFRKTYTIKVPPGK